VVDPVANLEFGVAQEMGIVFTSEEAGQAEGFAIEGVLEALVDDLGVGFLALGQRSIVHAVASWREWISCR
jgi:hypothetical protein